jgi:hypothetical protein
VRTGGTDPVHRHAHESTLPLLLLAALALGAVRCSGDEDPTGPPPPDPVPGSLVLVVRSPNGAEGAALIDVAAATVAEVTPDSGSVIQVPDGERLRIAIVRNQPGTLSAVLAVSDTAAPLDIRLLQVADAVNGLRPSLAGYTVEVVR